MIAIHKYKWPALSFITFFCLFSELHAFETLDSKIMAVGNGQIVVEINTPTAGQAYPAKGDKVKFWVEIIGLDESVDAGDGVVLSVDGKTVTVKGIGKLPPLEGSAKISATGMFQVPEKEPDPSVLNAATSVSPTQSRTTQAVPPPKPQQLPLHEMDEDALRHNAESGDSEAMYLLGKKLDVLFGHVTKGW